MPADIQSFSLLERCVSASVWMIIGSCYAGGSPLFAVSVPLSLSALAPKVGCFGIRDVGTRGSGSRYVFSVQDCPYRMGSPPEIPRTGAVGVGQSR